MYGKLGYNTFRATENNLDALNRIVENVTNTFSIGYKKNQTSFTETLNGEIVKQESKDFSQGPLRRTGDEYDLAIEGKGFFEVEMPNGQRAYTRAGRFHLTSEGELVTAEGYRVIPEVEPVTLPAIDPSKTGEGELGVNFKITSPKLTVSPTVTPEITEDGTLNGIDPNSGEKVKIGKINVVVFNNPQGLESISKSYFIPTQSSGQPLDTEVGPGAASRVRQGYVEFGNVTMASEFMDLTHMKDLITAQMKLLKAIDKLYENVHYTISKSA